MAERRMFSKTIIDSDIFLDMPVSAQALYFHMAMRADDDGFLNNPKKVQRMVGASDDDFRILLAKQFVILFDSGVVVIRHWKIHNFIRSDRYHETVYQNEKNLLHVGTNKSYEMLPEQHEIVLLPNNYTVSDVGMTLGIPNGNQMDTEVSLGKDSLGKDRQGKSNARRAAAVDDNVEELFERLWRLYPKKEGKRKVSKDAKKALVVAGYDRVAAAIDAYKEQIERNHTDDKYIKHGSTFFNGDWHDFDAAENIASIKGGADDDGGFESY